MTIICVSETKQLLIKVKVHDRKNKNVMTRYMLPLKVINLTLTLVAEA